MPEFIHHLEGYLASPVEALTSFREFLVHRLPVHPPGMDSESSKRLELPRLGIFAGRAGRAGW